MCLCRNSSGATTAQAEVGALQGQIAQLLADKARLAAEAAAATALSHEWQHQHEQIRESSSAAMAEAVAAATAAAVAAAAATTTPASARGTPAAATAAPAEDDDAVADALWLPRQRVAWSDGPAACAEAFEGLLRAARHTLVRGETLWATKKKRAALRLYQTAVGSLVSSLPREDCSLWTALSAAAAAAEEFSAANAPAKVALTLKRSIDEFIAALGPEINALRAKAGLQALDLVVDAVPASSQRSLAGSAAVSGAASGRESKSEAPRSGGVSALHAPVGPTVSVLSAAAAGDAMSQQLRVAELEMEVEDLRRCVAVVGPVAPLPSLRHSSPSLQAAGSRCRRRCAAASRLGDEWRPLLLCGPRACPELLRGEAGGPDGHRGA